jgi:hypothetical protein
LALSPVFWAIISHITWNHKRSGFRLSSNTVPAVTEL